MSWEEINQNLSTRKKDTIASLINNPGEATFSQIILSSEDMGVIRNGGRNGSKFGPETILASLKKMSRHNISKQITVSQSCFVNNAIVNFDAFQETQTKIIEDFLQSTAKNYIHIGSGHDFIYPFAKAIYNSSTTNNKKIAIINFDAHLDTRNDNIHHSGTPFRQLSKLLGSDMLLYQIGIHDFANAPSNYEGVQMKIYTLQEILVQTMGLRDNKAFISQICKELKDVETIILSVDLDAFKSEQISAVSAPNHMGLSLEFLGDFIEQYLEMGLNKNYIGLYEYNPLFDDLAVSNARRVNSQIIKFLK